MSGWRWKNQTRAVLPPAAKLFTHSGQDSTVNPSDRRRYHRRKTFRTWIARLLAGLRTMHSDLPALAAKIGQRLSISSEYVVTQPAELRVLREMSEDEVREFARSHGWRIIRRLGGRQIEFYNDASVRAL